MGLLLCNNYTLSNKYIPLVLLLEHALIDQLQYGSRKGWTGHPENEGGLLKVLYGSVLLDVTDDSRRECLQGKLVQALAQEHTVVGYDRQVVSQDQFVGFDDSQDTLLVYDPEVTVTIGQYGNGEYPLGTE